MKKIKYIHVCGRPGCPAATWLAQRLSEQGKRLLLVDCSREGALMLREEEEDHLTVKRCGRMETSRFLPGDAQDWELLLLYHEEMDIWLEEGSGQAIYLLFSDCTAAGIGLLAGLLEWLSKGTLKLYEPYLQRQLMSSGRIYVLSLFQGKKQREFYLPEQELDLLEWGRMETDRKRNVQEVGGELGKLLQNIHSLICGTEEENKKETDF